MAQLLPQMPVLRRHAPSPGSDLHSGPMDHAVLHQAQEHKGLMVLPSLGRINARGFPKLPREVVGSPSLEIFKTRLEEVLCSLL